MNIIKLKGGSAKLPPAYAPEQDYKCHTKKPGCFFMHGLSLCRCAGASVCVFKIFVCVRRCVCACVECVYMHVCVQVCAFFSFYVCVHVYVCVCVCMCVEYV